MVVGGQQAVHRHAGRQQAEQGVGQGWASNEVGSPLYVVIHFPPANRVHRECGRTKIDAAGATFRSLTEAVDTSGPAGRMMMQMLGSFAEFERAMVRERTRAGLKAAAARGRKGDGNRSSRRNRRRRSWTASAQAGRVRLISPG